MRAKGTCVCQYTHWGSVDLSTILHIFKDKNRQIQL